MELLKEPQGIVKLQGKKLDVEERCENLDRVVDSSGVEANLTGGRDVTSEAQFPIPVTGGVVSVIADLKLSARVKAFMQEFGDACGDPDKCNDRSGGQFSGFIELMAGLAVFHPDLLSITGGARGGFSGSLSIACGEVSGGACAGPVTLRGKVSVIGFVNFQWAHAISPVLCLDGNSLVDF